MGQGGTVQLYNQTNMKTFHWTELTLQVIFYPLQIEGKYYKEIERGGGEKRTLGLTVHSQMFCFSFQRNSTETTLTISHFFLLY